MKTFIMSLVFLVIAARADQSDLCGQTFNDSVQFANHVETRPASDPNTITLITWNAHKYADTKYFGDLNGLANSADILMVQEAMHSTDWQLAFASHFNFSFSFFKSFCTSSNFATGVQTAARFPLEDNRIIISTDTEPVSFTPKVTGLSRINVAGHGSVLLVNTHALNFNFGNLFEHQIDQIISYLATETGPVIWGGDFNTWSQGRKDYLQQKATSIGFSHVVIKNENRKLILDHIYVRGFTTVQAEVMPQASSDHQPLRAVLRFKN